MDSRGSEGVEGERDKQRDGGESERKCTLSFGSEERKGIRGEV